MQRAEVHAAISVAGVAAALAAMAAENAEPSQSNALKDIAVASAAALVAQQCAQVAEAVGAKHEQLTSAINAAITATDANNIITLTAAAATCIALFLYLPISLVLVSDKFHSTLHLTRNLTNIIWHDFFHIISII